MLLLLPVSAMDGVPPYITGQLNLIEKKNIHRIPDLVDLVVNLVFFIQISIHRCV